MGEKMQMKVDSRNSLLSEHTHGVVYVIQLSLLFKSSIYQMNDDEGRKKN